MCSQISPLLICAAVVKFDASMILLAGKQVKGLNILYRKMLAGQKCEKLSLICAREIQMCHVHWREKGWHENVPCASLAVKNTTRKVHAFFSIAWKCSTYPAVTLPGRTKAAIEVSGSLSYFWESRVSTAVGHGSRAVTKQCFNNNPVWHYHLDFIHPSKRRTLAKWQQGKKMYGPFVIMWCTFWPCILSFGGQMRNQRVAFFTLSSWLCAACERHVSVYVTPMKLVS